VIKTIHERRSQLHDLRLGEDLDPLNPAVSSYFDQVQPDQYKLALKGTVVINAGVVIGGNGEIAVRLGAALLIGAALGLNRDLHGKPAGLRTHGLVSLGAAVAAIVSLGLPGESKSMDPNAISRVLQGILTGIGFLGAGVIQRDTAGHVTGLTTAATIWICGALGVVCGLAYWSVLAIALGLTVAALSLGGPIEHLAERLLKARRSKPPDPSV
jgi:putative Mg2+ transporter-C (MgtC) family protein